MEGTIPPPMELPNPLGIIGTVSLLFMGHGLRRNGGLRNRECDLRFEEKTFFTSLVLIFGKKWPTIWKAPMAYDTLNLAPSVNLLLHSQVPLSFYQGCFIISFVNYCERREHWAWLWDDGHIKMVEVIKVPPGINELGINNGLYVPQTIYLGQRLHVKITCVTSPNRVHWGWGLKILNS